jgi:type IV pilus assembly protein PilB
LVDAGTITREQLGEALRRQEHSGGKLGTNLIELSYVDEKTLAAALAQQYQVPSVTQAQLERIAPDVIALVPGPLAARLRVVPLRLDTGRLWLAMMDPSDRDGLDEIARLVKKAVRPTVAPDVAIQAALERHYHLPPRHNRPGPRPYAPRVDETPLRVMLESRQPQARPPPPPQEDEVHLDEADVHTGYLDEEVAPRGFADESQLPQLLQRMAEAHADEEVLEAVLHYLSPAAARMCILTLRKQELTGWRGINVNAAQLAAMRVPLANYPLFQVALQAGQSFVGKLEALGGLGTLLGVRGDVNGMVVPIRVGQRPAGVLIGVDASPEALRKRPELDKLALKIDHALHLQYLRRALLQP